MVDIKLFQGLLPEEAVRQGESMSAHTTFKTGGKAELMLLPSSVEQITGAVEICRDNGIKYYIIGNGSNLLVSDKGIEGVVIKLGKGFSRIEADGEKITAQSGALLSAVASAALKEALSGMEFASGIPGTLGGAACMNAGAYGGEMKDIIKEVTVYHKGEVRALSWEECGFRYRGSRIMDENMLVLGAEIALRRGNFEEIKALMEDYSQRRRLKQPLDKPSAGSTFKRPQGDFAGRLIEAAGLKGFAIGGAQVSEKHCGFVINTGGAASGDIAELIRAVQNKVFESSGVMLEPEVRFIGEF